jgi:hypothetical protein
MKKRLYFLITILFCIALTGCLGEKTKTYTSHGASIELPTSFYEKDLASATAYFESNKAIISFVKEEFTILESVGITKDTSLDTYAEAVLSNNKLTSEIKKQKEYQYFTYEKSASGKNFFYTSAVFKTDDAFWLINFACDIKDKDAYQTEFLKWADTMKFE